MTDEKRKDSIAAKLLLPVVATIASGVASYLAKKGPQLIDDALLPKLREAKESTGDVAHDLTDRARSVVHGGDTDAAGADEVSNDDLERRRRERADHRAARRKAS